MLYNYVVINFIHRIILAIFTWSGAVLFREVTVWCDDTGTPRALHFADSERDLNCSMRDYVEALDNSYSKT